MGTVLLWILALLLPTLVGCAVVWARPVLAAWRRSRPAAPPPPLERVTADVRRLHRLLRETEDGVATTAKSTRRAATRAAYVDALGEACRRLDVAEPHGPTVTQAEIYRVEADLRRRGLDVRAGR